MKHSYLLSNGLVSGGAYPPSSSQSKAEILPFKSLFIVDSVLTKNRDSRRHILNSLMCIEDTGQEKIRDILSDIKKSVINWWNSCSSLCKTGVNSCSS